ncbi:MAG: hypothetical protein ACRC1P_09505 [Cellulosilyticaceae bacterium]
MKYKFKGVDHGDNYLAYRDAVNKHCVDSKCPFYYGEINECMFGEDGVNEKIGIENKKCTLDMWE